jgi:ligand-binding sensor domain-containing protein
MKSAFLLRLITLFLSLFSALSALGQQPVLTKIPPPEGVFWSGIMGMGQDPQGFVWLATQYGLFRYDGYRYVPYYHDPDNANSPASNRTESLFVSESGIVWIGYLKNGLDRFDPATGTFTHFTHDPNDPGSLSSNAVGAILEDRQGVLWVGTDRGLNRLLPESGTFTRYLHDLQDPSSLSNDYVGSLYEDRQGTLWVGG